VHGRGEEGGKGFTWRGGRERGRKREKEVRRGVEIRILPFIMNPLL
jgi:hypothetical protein